MPAPVNLRVERGLLRSGARAVACMDEVGRGSLSGPVAVGVVVVNERTAPAPKGVRDSKLLTAKQRSELVPLIRTWAPHGVGMATPQEIDEHGIMAAMGLAAWRGLSATGVSADHVLLDGNVDYVSRPAQGELFEVDAECRGDVRVTTRVKADMTCAGVAAASVLAKTARDALMVELAREHPEYGWESNKGYAAEKHREALQRLGPTPHHRLSWALVPVHDA